MASGSHKQIGYDILLLLQQQTDREHRLLQEDIIRLLEEKTGHLHMRKSIRSNLNELQEAGFPVKCDSGWYYDHEFSNEELHLIVDGVRSVNGITDEQIEELRRKACRMGGIHYTPQERTKAPRAENPQFLQYLNTMHNAIRDGVMVSFCCGEYGVDKQLHARLNRRGSPKVYTVHPYHVAAVNGKYFLIASEGDKTELMHFRLDLIMELRRTRKKARPFSDVHPGDFCLCRYIAQHPLMIAGPVKEYRLRIIRNEAIGNLMDWFGFDIALTQQEDGVFANICCDQTSIDVWMTYFGNQVELLPSQQEQTV